MKSAALLMLVPLVASAECQSALGANRWTYADRLLSQYKVSSTLRLTRVGRLSYRDWGSRGFTRAAFMDVRLHIRDEAEWRLVRDAMGLSRPARVAGLPKTISLRELLPARAREVTNGFPVIKGPNCWSASLLWCGLMRKLDYVGQPEMEKFLESNFDLVPVGEKLVFGDVIAYRGSYADLQHTAIFIDGKTIWHKPSSAQTSPWAFDDFKAVANNYFKINDYPPRKNRVDFYRLKRASR